MNFQFREKNSGEMSADGSFWPHLKQAISSTSGFHRWATEEGVNLKSKEIDLDELIHSYLRQTLETLAY